jgi:hypothetical protein
MREVLDGREFRGCDIVPADDRGSARPPASRGGLPELPTARENDLPLCCNLLESRKTPLHL